jgi:hypothetical protein
MKISQIQINGFSRMVEHRGYIRYVSEILEQQTDVDCMARGFR